MITDRGSALVEFTGVSLLVTACALGVLQIGMIAHVKAALTDSAIAGAAHAALADSSLSAGVARATELADAGIAAGIVTDIVADRITVSGRAVARVTIHFGVPAIGPWVPTVASQVSGRALVEIP